MTELSIRINLKMTRWLWHTMGTVFGFSLLVTVLLWLAWQIG